MKKKTLTVISTLLIAFFAFGATATAANFVANPDDSTLLELFRPVADAVKNGEGLLAASLAIIFLMAAAKRYLPDRFGGKFVRSDVGGVLSTFVFAFAGSMATALAAPGAALNAAMFLAALKFAGGAIGGFVAIHKLATWLVGTAWFQSKAPAWLRAGLALLLNLIGSSAIKKAEAAGQKAVEQSPPQGPEAVVGEIGKI